MYKFLFCIFVLNEISTLNRIFFLDYIQIKQL